MTRRGEEVDEAARKMIRRFGLRAGEEVDQRVRELHQSGDHEATLFWLEIHSRVVELLNSGEVDGFQ